MTIDEKETLCHAIWVYGEKAQKLMAIEEMSELTKEICKDFRGKLDETHVAEEIADVEIMLEQLKIIYARLDGNFWESISEFKRYKIERLKKRLEEMV